MIARDLFREYARKELTQADAYKTPPVSKPPKKDELRTVVVFNSFKLNHYATAYAWFSQADDPFREQVRMRAHETLDVIYDAIDEMQKAKS